MDYWGDDQVLEQSRVGPTGFIHTYNVKKFKVFNIFKIMCSLYKK